MFGHKSERDKLWAEVLELRSRIVVLETHALHEQIDAYRQTLLQPPVKLKKKDYKGNWEVKTRASPYVWTDEQKKAQSKRMKEMHKRKKQGLGPKRKYVKSGKYSKKAK